MFLQYVSKFACISRHGVTSRPVHFCRLEINTDDKETQHYIRLSIPTGRTQCPLLICVTGIPLSYAGENIKPKNWLENCDRITAVPYFMEKLPGLTEPGLSLPSSQGIDISLCLVPNTSSSCPLLFFLKIHFNIIYLFPP
jgi:hypothetical protein